MTPSIMANSRIRENTYNKSDTSCSIKHMKMEKMVKLSNLL